MLNLYVFWYGWYDTINNKKEHMIETLQIFWNAPIELQVIILAVLIAFPILAYLSFPRL
jgi:hypothetical protein